MAWKEKKWDSKIAKKLKKKVNGNWLTDYDIYQYFKSQVLKGNNNNMHMRHTVRRLADGHGY
jgi:hypothetical protein